jgi:hypothetical protein
VVQAPERINFQYWENSPVLAPPESQYYPSLAPPGNRNSLVLAPMESRFAYFPEYQITNNHSKFLHVLNIQPQEMKVIF